MAQQERANIISGLVLLLVVCGIVGAAAWGITKYNAQKTVAQVAAEKEQLAETLENKEQESASKLATIRKEFEDKLATFKSDDKISSNYYCIDGADAVAKEFKDNEQYQKFLKHVELATFAAKAEGITWCNFVDIDAFLLKGDFGPSKSGEKIGKIIGFTAREANDFVYESMNESDFGDPQYFILGQFSDTSLLYKKVAGGDGSYALYVLREDGESAIIETCSYMSKNNELLHICE